MSRLRPFTQSLVVGVLAVTLASLLVLQPTARALSTGPVHPLSDDAQSALRQPWVNLTVPKGPSPTTSSTAPPTTAAEPKPSPPSATPSFPANAADIGIADGHLVLDGKPYRFLGLNAYEIGTEWGTNAGCGDMVSQSQLDGLFASLPPNSLVRFWAFQETIATNVHTGELDWGPLDRVFATASAYHQRLIVVLTDQGGTCDGEHWQDPSWYLGGFQQVFDEPGDGDGKGLTSLSYWQYMQDVVNRYKDSPALGMWEPISEPEASTCPPQYEPTDCSGHQTCPDEAEAAGALRHFFDVVGGEIHTLDPDHLVEDGLLGGGQCGTSGSDYAYVSASPGIDVLSYHDYYPADEPLGGDQWNGLAVRFAQAASLDKPVIAGELGVTAGDGPGCTSLGNRVTQVQAKIDAQMQAGSSGVLVWDWEPAVTSDCAYDVVPGDPLVALIGGGVSPGS